MTKNLLNFLKWYSIIVGIGLIIIFVVLQTIIYSKPAVQTEEAQASEKNIERLILAIPQPEEIEVTIPYTKEIQYNVKQGDTLWKIAESFRENAFDYPVLAKRNGIENANFIYAGQYLTIPIDSTETVTKKSDWFFRHDIPITQERNFSIQTVQKNIQTGEIKGVFNTPFTVEIRTLDIDAKRSGYKLVEASFIFHTEKFLS